MSSPVLASSLGADPEIFPPSHPNCPTLHLNFSQAQRTGRSLACRSLPSLLRVTGKIHPRRGSCCPRRRAAGRSLRRMSRPAPGAGIPQRRRGARSRPGPGMGWGSPRLWCYLASSGPRSPPGSTEARLERTWWPRCLRRGSLIRDLNNRLTLSLRVKGLITPWINTGQHAPGDAQVQENQP